MDSSLESSFWSTEIAFLPKHTDYCQWIFCSFRKTEKQDEQEKKEWKLKEKTCQNCGTGRQVAPESILRLLFKIKENRGK